MRTYRLDGFAESRWGFRSAKATNGIRAPLSLWEEVGASAGGVLKWGISGDVARGASATYRCGFRQIRRLEPTTPSAPLRNGANFLYGAATLLAKEGNPHSPNYSANFGQLCLQGMRFPPRCPRVYAASLN
jgi:hypothetical protein